MGCKGIMLRWLKIQSSGRLFGRRDVPQSHRVRSPDLTPWATALAGLVLVTSGCGGGDGAGKLSPKSPKEAASGLETAFSGAGGEASQTVAAAAGAMKSGDYEKAAMSLGALRGGGNLTLDQGLAVHSSMLALEEQLIRGVESGDPKARQAYEVLKRMKKK